MSVIYVQFLPLANGMIFFFFEQAKIVYINTCRFPA